MKSNYGVYEKGAHMAWTGTKNTREYDIWKAMMQRCYNPRSSVKYPTYTECTVCEEWHNFQNFAEWYKNESKSKTGRLDLDKDLKISGNKVYSPETCLLIDKSLNIFLRDSSKGRGKYLIGVSIVKGSGNFRSRCNNPITGKTEQVGTFKTEIEAHLAWRKRKSEIARELAEAQSDQEVKKYLIKWADNL